MRSLMHDRVTLVKPDERRFPNILASVQIDKIFTDDEKLPIEEGDFFERSLPSGLVETYQVTDRGFMEGMGGIPSHYQSKVRKVTARSAPRLAEPSALDLFISHSSKDVELADRLIKLIRAGLNLSARAIRCSSVDGYRLPGGAKTDDQLRSEVHDSKAFLGIISSVSLDSMYVTFELGARWGAGKHLLPVLAPGVSTTQLSGPLAGITALRADSAAQLHQLVQDLGRILELQPEPPASLLTHIDHVLALAVRPGHPSDPDLRYQILSLVAQYHSQEIPATPVRIARDLELEASDVLSHLNNYHDVQLVTFRNDGRKPEVETAFFLSPKAWEHIKIVRA